MNRQPILCACGLVMVMSLAVGLQTVRSQQTTQKTAAKAAEANPADPTIVKELVGDWTNELGSTLTIKSIDTETGAIRGCYRTKPGAGTQGEDYTLIGWINHARGDDNQNHVTVVSFSVRWGKIGSVAAWNGYYAQVSDTPTIVGQWLLSRSNSSFEWDHI